MSDVHARPRVRRRRSRLAPGVAVRTSLIEGRGLFAARRFAAGEVVAVLGGRVVDDQAFGALARREASVSAEAIEEGWHLVQEDDDPLRFGNHSCDPNLWLVDEVTLVARRAIAADEEITSDYATMTVDPTWRMPCRCGAEACRGVVTGRDWEDPEVQHRYAGHFVPFLGRRIARRNPGPPPAGGG